MVREEIVESIKKVAREVTGLEVDPQLDWPTDGVHGDYSSNIAFVASKKLKKSPIELAEEIKTHFPKLDFIEKVEVAKPGFINFWLSEAYLSTELAEVLKQKEKVATAGKSLGQKIMVEFAHPNTHKLFHIGHLRNITLGESLVRLLESQGVEVIRANYQGDVGLHIAKALYGLLQISNLKSQISKLNRGQLSEKIELLGRSYAKGAKAYEEDEKAQETIRDINYLIYASAQKFQQEKGVAPGSTDYMQFVKGREIDVEKIYDLWKTTRQWSLDYFERIYKRVYTHYDRYYFESECLFGVDIAKEALKKGVLKKSDGAIIFDGKPYGLDTRVFVNSLGLPTYEGKELALASKEFSEFGPLDKLIHVVAPEQTSFFKITFKAEELLDPQKYKGKQYHFAYGWVRLKKGKMSSRTGQVVLGEWLLDKAKKRLVEKYNMKEKTAEIVAVGAVKYSLLKASAFQEIIFDIDESINLEGNAGPYLQYTFARTQSILGKAKMSNDLELGISFARPGLAKLEPEELVLLRLIHRFPEVVEGASQAFAPNLVCNYLFDLAQKFNLFYQKHKVLGSKREEFRLALTGAVGKIIKEGLYLLGIEAPQRM